MTGSGGAGDGGRASRARAASDCAGGSSGGSDGADEVLTLPGRVSYLQAINLYARHRATDHIPLVLSPLLPRGLTPCTRAPSTASARCPSQLPAGPRSAAPSCRRVT